MSTSSKISTLWIVIMINMGFADILSFMYPGFLAQITTGTVDGVTITPMFLLVAAVFLEVGIAMIYLSRALARPMARVLNLIAVVLTIAFVIGGGALTIHYIFFATVEVLCMIYIAVLAWRWRED
jgi:hypothetical protein